LRIGCRSARKIIKKYKNLTDEEDKKIQKLKFDSIYLTDKSLVEKENSIRGEKFKIRCLWTQLNFIEGLIEFMEGLFARKNAF